MFKTKYKVSILNSQWQPLERNLKLSVIPRKDEYLYFLKRYYSVLNVVHNITNGHEILIIVEEETKQPNK
jgi:hypothetical protein